MQSRPWPKRRCMLPHVIYLLRVLPRSRWTASEVMGVAQAAGAPGHPQSRRPPMAFLPRRTWRSEAPNASVGTDECRWARPAVNTSAGCGWDGTGVWTHALALFRRFCFAKGDCGLGVLQVVHTQRRPPEGLEADKLAAHSGCRSSALSCSVYQARALASTDVGRRSRCCKHARCPGLPHEGSTQAGWVMATRHCRVAHATACSR